MACPNCGGIDRYEISPGFWQCTGTVTQLVARPGPQGPQFGPPAIPITSPCNFQYQEGPVTVTRLCSSVNCGRYSVGNCVDCGKPVCGMCSPGYGGLLCRPHREVRRVEQAKAAAKQKLADEKRWEEARTADRAAKEKEADRVAKAHQQKVNAVRAKYGDDQTIRERVEQLDEKLKRKPRGFTLGCIGTVFLALVGYCVAFYAVLGVGTLLTGSTPTDKMAGLAGLVLAIAVVLRCVATPMIRSNHAEERERLITRIGCGDPHCPQCRIDRSPARAS